MVEYVWTSIAKPLERSQLLLEFYGPDLATFKVYNEFFRVLIIQVSEKNIVSRYFQDDSREKTNHLEISQREC